MTAFSATSCRSHAEAEWALGNLVRGVVRTTRAARRYDIGYPGAHDLTFPELAEIITGQLLNNVGDPWHEGHGKNQTKDVERRVVAEVADLLRAPSQYWGYVTTGSTEGTLHALSEAGRLFPDTVVYASLAAHYSVAKSARLLRLPLVTVPTTVDDRMDVSALRLEIEPRRHRAVAVVATAGTTMAESVDDVVGIVDVCDRLAVTRRRIHVDAALSGIPLALLPDGERPGFDFSVGATSMVISGHKFLSTLMPCGVLVHARAPQDDERISYTGSADTTILGSRSGHTPLLLWWALTSLGREGLHRRAESSRQLAVYAHAQLQAAGWPARIQPQAFTVVLRKPPRQVLDKWVLATDGNAAHIICVPGVQRDQIDEFVSDLRASVRRTISRLGEQTRAPDDVGEVASAGRHGHLAAARSAEDRVNTILPTKSPAAILAKPS